MVNECISTLRSIKLVKICKKKMKYNETQIIGRRHLNNIMCIVVIKQIVLPVAKN